MKNISYIYNILFHKENGKRGFRSHNTLFLTSSQSLKLKGLKMMDYKPPNNLMKSLALNVYSQMKDHKLTSPKKVGRCLERVIFFFSPSERPGAQGTRLKSLKGLKRLEEVVKLNARTLVRFDYAVIIAYGGYALKGGTHFIRSERYSQGRINLTSFGHLPEYLLK